MKFGWLFLLYFPLFLFGQESDTLEEVEVTAASKLQPSETHWLKRIEAHQLETHQGDNLDVLLSENCNLYVKSYGAGNLSTLSIRGGGAQHTKIYWNGIEINSPTLGQLDLATLPVIFTDEVEFHLGSSSSVDGSGALGGALELNNYATYRQKSKLSLYKALGSFNTDKTAINASYGNTRFQGKTSLFRHTSANNFSYLDISLAEPSYQQRKNAALEQYGFRQDVYFKPAVSHELSLKTNFFKSYREIPGAIGTVSNAANQQDWNARALLQWNFFQTKASHHFRAAYLNDWMQYNDTTSGIQSEIQTKSIKSSYQFRYAFNDSLKFQVFVNNDYTLANSSGFASMKTQNKTGLFLMGEYRWKSLLYSLSARQEVIDNKVMPFAPSLGVRWYLPKTKWSLFANGGKNYKAPSLNELYWNPGGNPNLLAETSYTSEGGVGYRTNKIEASVHLYYASIDNWILWMPTELGYWKAFNLQKVHNRGVEMQIGYSIRKKKSILRTNIGYQFTESVLKENYGFSENLGKQIIYVPKHSISFQAHFSHQRWQLSYRQNYTGKVFIDAGNTTYMPHYLPASLSANYRLKSDKQKNLGTFGLQINNLWNEDYQIVANQPLPKRWFLLHLNIVLEN